VPLAHHLDAYTTLHLQPEDSARALEWFKRFRLSHGIGILDCLIASIALRAQKPLCTFNARHYAALPDLSLSTPYSRTAAT
jgi:predicted nucleic acid-binding protein